LHTNRKSTRRGLGLVSARNSDVNYNSRCRNWQHKLHTSTEHSEREQFYTNRKYIHRDLGLVSAGNSDVNSKSRCRNLQHKLHTFAELSEREQFHQQF